jgi:UTP15 C terminal
MRVGYKVEEYGVRRERDRRIIRVGTHTKDSLGAMFLGDNTVVYGDGGYVYKKEVSENEDEKKIFAKLGEGVTRMAEKDGLIAVASSGGRIQIVDRKGAVLRKINCPFSLRSIAFLSATLLALGGNDSLTVYSLSETDPFYQETGFRDYVDSICGNGRYVAVALSCGEVHLYTYTHKIDEKRNGSISEKKDSFSLVKTGEIEVEGSSKLTFVSESRLFIATGSGRGVIYDVESEKVVMEKPCHSKGISALLHREFLFTCSFDGKFKVFNENLSLLSSFALPSPILAFDVSLRPRSRQYLFSTMDGGVWVLRDGWQIEPIEKPPEKKRAKTMKQYNQESEMVVRESLSVHREKKEWNKYEGLVNNFFYRKALRTAVGDKDERAVISILDYLHSIGRLRQAVSENDEAFVSELIDIALDLIGDDQLSLVGTSTILETARAYLDEYQNPSSLLGSRLSSLVELVEEERAIMEETCILKSLIECVLIGGEGLQ